MASHSSSAERTGLSRSGRRRFRFPCGHLESEVTIAGRVRRTDGAAWVRCRACNVIVLTRCEESTGQPRGNGSRRGDRPRMLTS